MGLKLKGKRLMEKEDAGKLLIRLGEGLKSGELRYPEAFGEDRDLGVNDPLEVEVEYKEKHGRNKFEVEIKWKVGQKGDKVTGKIETRKAVKRDMKATLYEVEKAIELGKLTAANAAFKRFQELNRRFNDLAEGEWERDMNAQNKLIAGLENALSLGDTGAALGMVNKLWKLKKTCHGKYKEY
jgi:amphi-Trp domain-containing protein